MIAPPDGDWCCPLPDEVLMQLLEDCQSYEKAAYRACIMLSLDDSITTADGVRVPSQTGYWLRRAHALRGTFGGCICRKDEVKRQGD